MRKAESKSTTSIRHGHFIHFTGLYFDEWQKASVWLRDRAEIRFPRFNEAFKVVLHGSYQRHPDARGCESGSPSLRVDSNGAGHSQFHPEKPGAFQIELFLPSEEDSPSPVTVCLSLGGVGFTNFLAWAGRITRWRFLQRFRCQNKNRQLRVERVTTESGELIFDFSNRNAPYSGAFARAHTHIGINVAGFLSADLGVGESARCMVRAADAAGVDAALVPLKLHCKNPMRDLSMAPRFQDSNPHLFNIFHIDPPASRDIDHHHGATFRSGKYNIAYWAWELPEFPDAWIPHCAYFNEIWCPSDFTRDAIAMKVSLPVLTMPHAIRFNRPIGDPRAHFGFPHGQYLFLVLYDLNSYSARKNPEAAIRAFRESGLTAKGAGLILKVHNVAGNEADLARLRNAVSDLPGTRLLTETLTRDEITLLQAACDCYVSLHRSEGFGLGVAECMYLGKPVISTDWSATAEFVNANNGCPVRYKLRELEQNHGPYGKGQIWAEADIAHAAAYMRRLFEDREYAENLGQKARQTIESRFSPEGIGTRYRRRLENITLWS